MSSIGELEKRVELLSDEINDIFHATSLNLQALAVQLQPYSDSKIIQGTLGQCQKEFQHIQYLFKQRANLRLEYLITEQIKEEEGKVRRERLVEYEEKIYDQRRLISDKQAFYEALLKPRKRRPAHMTIEEFQAQRKQELMIEERKNLKRLQEQTNQLKQIQKCIKMDNRQLQSMLERLEKEEIPQEELDNLCVAIEKNPSIYESIVSISGRKEDKEELKKIFQNVTRLQDSNEEIYKQYLEQKQLHEYLRWENQKLKAEYIQNSEKGLANQVKNRKMIDRVGKYKIQRSLSL